MNTGAAPSRPRTDPGRIAPVGIVLMALGLTGCDPGSPSPEVSDEVSSPRPETPWFQEVASEAGIDFRMSTGHRPEQYLMPEIKGGGLGLLDFDGDGLLDIVCVQAGSLHPGSGADTAHRLYRNLGDWRFADVTEVSGIRSNGSYGMGCACGDYDNDGDPDIYLTALGRNTLYRNNGDGTFSDVTDESGVGDPRWGMSAAFADLDADGDLDLFVANYIGWSREREVPCYSQGGQPDYCSPLAYKAPTVDTLYRNRGDGVFENAAKSAGLDRAYGYGLGVVAADFNGDRQIDLYVANDATPNQLWINQGNGKFVDEAMVRGCAVNSMGMSEAGMGLGVVDLFERGVFDLFVTHLVGEMNRFYSNTNGYFVDLILPKGAGANSWPHTSFGLGFHDFDNDGELDLYIANGRVKRGPTDLDPDDEYAEPNTLMRGLGRGMFQELSPPGGAHPVLMAASRGAAFGDLDNDGGVDVIITNRDGPTHVLRNLAGDGGHWIVFRVLDRRGRVATGALLRIRTEAGNRWQYVMPHQSYCSSNDPRVHFGLGAEERVDALTIYWPTGEEERFGAFDGDRIHVVRQDAAAP